MHRYGVHRRTNTGPSAQDVLSAMVRVHGHPLRGHNDGDIELLRGLGLLGSEGHAKVRPVLDAQRAESDARARLDDLAQATDANWGRTAPMQGVYASSGWAMAQKELKRAFARRQRAEKFALMAIRHLIANSPGDA